MKLFSDPYLADLLLRSRMPEFAPACDRLRAEVASLEEMGLSVPEVSAGYFHDYFCPEHAVALAWAPHSPKAHRCPVDGKVFTGQPFDGAWLWPVNTTLSRGAFKSALLWRMDGDEAHRRRAEAILTGYASRYASYAILRQGMRLRGRCCYHSLDESVWLIPLTQAYDLIREGLTAPGQVAGDLLIPAAEHIATQQLHQTHNIECWHHAAIGTVGVCLDRPDFIDLAVNSRYGFWRQLEEGVRPDGFWYEGSTSYHFYTMAAMIALATSTAAAGLELHRAERLRRMFEAPVEYAYPDLGMPAMNDCWYFTTLMGECCHNTPDAAGFYEVGCAWYGEAFAWLLEENYRRHKRDTLEALLYGKTDLTHPHTPSLSPWEREGATRASPPGRGRVRSSHASRLFPDSGYAVLRAERPETYLLLKYGPHGGGHGHPDKLSLILHACGAPVSPDLGTPGYGIAVNNTWYRRTISHNTVLIDRLSQPPGEGRLNRFDGAGEEGFLAADASVSWEEGSYAGVRMRRVILMRKANLTHPHTPSLSHWEREGATSASPPGRGRVRSSTYFIDLFAVTCDRPRQIDWVFRVKGAEEQGRGGEITLAPLPPCSPAGEGGVGRLEGEGYEHIANVRAGQVRDRARLSWRVGQGGVDLFLVGDSEVFVGDAPFNPASERTDVVVVRRRAKATIFASVFCVHEGGPRVRDVRDVTEGLGVRDAIGLSVETEEGEETWVVSLK